MEGKTVSVRTLGAFPLYKFFPEGSTSLGVFADDPQGRMNLWRGLLGFIHEAAQKERGRVHTTAVDLATLEFDDGKKRGVIVYADGRRIKIGVVFGLPTFDIFCEAIGEADFITGTPSVIYLACPPFRSVDPQDPVPYPGRYEFLGKVGLRRLGETPFSGDGADSYTLSQSVKELFAAAQWGEPEVVTLDMDSPGRDTGALTFSSGERVEVRVFSWDQGGALYCLCVERQSGGKREFSVFFLGAGLRSPSPEMLCRA